MQTRRDSRCGPSDGDRGLLKWSQSGHSGVPDTVELDHGGGTGGGGRRPGEGAVVVLDRDEGNSPGPGGGAQLWRQFGVQSFAGLVVLVPSNQPSRVLVTVTVVSRRRSGW